MTVPIDGINALERSYDQLAKLVANLEAEQMTAPTNCPAWDVKALLNHILGGALMYTLVNDGQAALEDAGDVVGDDPATALAEISAANVASWRAPGALEGDRTYPWGTLPAGAGLISNVGEVALHAWDLAKATDQTADIDPDVAQIVNGFYQMVPMDDLRAHGVYGPEIAVPEDASVQDRLLGYLSRQP
jgi:uncharacterized protein (TIGR03086 family)